MSAANRDGASNPNLKALTPLAPTRFDRFELDETNAILLRDGAPVAVAPTPFAVLCALVRHPGMLLTKDALLDQIWGHQFVSESVLKTVISDLRILLGDDARKPRFIETVSRRGYRFIATTTAVEAATTRDHAHSAVSPPPSTFVGRRHALQQLHATWVRARTGKRSITWVAGEPGIGKTTLVEQFIAGLTDTLYIRGQCVEQHGGGEPYLPVLEALGELCRHDPAASALLRATAPTWLLQLPWLSSSDEREVLRRELAGVGADRALRELGEFLDRYTEQTPLLLVTEDLHWSDRATIQLIDYIARRRGSARFMWLATFRLTEVVALDHPLNPLRRELRLHRLCDEIVLDPFSASEVAEYVAQCAPSIDADEAFVRALQERTDGLPLFVASVLSELASQSARHVDEPTPVAQIANMAVPENLAAIIERYITRLDHERRHVLNAAAVCGVTFRVDTVAEAIGRDIAWVGQACDELQREGLWLATPKQREPAADSSYAFRHALFRQVMYDRMAPFQRAELHRDVGTALEQERAGGASIAAAELAVQFERGREPLKAAQYCAEAAEAALRHFSPRECGDLARHGLGLLERVPESSSRHDVEIALATLLGVSASHLLGFSSDEAKSALLRAHMRLGHVPFHRLRGLLLHSLGITLLARAEYVEALGMAERSDTLSSATNDPVLRLGVCIVEGDVHMLQGKPNESRVWFERGLDVISSLDQSSDALFLSDPRITILVLLALQLVHLGLVEPGRRRLAEMHACLHQEAQPLTRMIALWFEAVFEQRLGNAERVAELARQGELLVEEFSLAQGRTAFRWFRGWALARAGQAREGHALIREAYEENTRLGMLSGASETLGYAAEALLLAGDLDGAREELDQAFEVSKKLDERIYVPQLLLLDAAIARASGKSPAADDSVRNAMAESKAQGCAWFELRATLELVEHGKPTISDKQSLAGLIEKLPEAAGTATFQRAKTLLGPAPAH